MDKITFSWPAKKSIVSILFALFLLLIFHKGVASPLVPLEPIESGEKSWVGLGCDRLPREALGWAQQESLQTQRVQFFLAIAAERYTQWHAVLQANEGKKYAWEVGYFQPLSASLEHMQSSSDYMYGKAASDEELIDELKGAIAGCYEESDELSEVQDLLFEYQAMQAEHLGGVAEFISAMRMRLRDWLNVWQTLENTQAATPVGYFSPLNQEVELYLDARELVDSNAQLLRERYQHFLDKFLALAQRPPAQ